MSHDKYANAPYLEPIHPDDFADVGHYLAWAHGYARAPSEDVQRSAEATLGRLLLAAWSDELTAALSAWAAEKSCQCPGCAPLASLALHVERLNALGGPPTKQS